MQLDKRPAGGTPLQLVSVVTEILMSVGEKCIQALWTNTVDHLCEKYCMRKSALESWSFITFTIECCSWTKGQLVANFPSGKSDWGLACPIFANGLNFCGSKISYLSTSLDTNFAKHCKQVFDSPVTVAMSHIWQVSAKMLTYQTHG